LRPQSSLPSPPPTIPPPPPAPFSVPSSGIWNSKPFTDTKKRRHNKTSILKIIEGTINLPWTQTGVFWFLKDDGGFLVKFIAIEWSRFYPWYRENHGYAGMKNTSIREKFQPGKCRQNKHDKNSPPVWIEFDRAILKKFNIPLPINIPIDSVRTADPWWSEFKKPVPEDYRTTSLIPRQYKRTAKRTSKKTLSPSNKKIKKETSPKPPNIDLSTQTETQTLGVVPQTMTSESQPRKEEDYFLGNLITMSDEPRATNASESWVQDLQLPFMELFSNEIEISEDFVHSDWNTQITG